MNEASNKLNLLLYEEPIFNISLTNLQEIEWLGEKQSNLLLVIKKKQWQEVHKVFLEKILAALNYNQNDYMIALCKENLDVVHEIFKQKKEHIFNFGVRLNNLTFPQNKLIKIHNANFIETLDLSSLEQDAKVKTIFWNQIKHLKKD